MAQKESWQQEPGLEETVRVKEKKPTRKKWLWVVWLLVVALLAYVVVQVLIIVLPDVRTETAIQETMVDAMDVYGVVAMDGNVVTAPAGGGILHYTASVGERVAAGGKVADIYGSEEAASARLELDAVQKELEQLETAQKSLGESSDVEILLKQRQNDIYSLLDVLDSGNYSDLDGIRAEVTMVNNKLQVATGGEISFEERLAQLTAQRDGLESMAIPQGTLTTDKSGYFVPSGRYDRLMTSYETAANTTPVDLQVMLEAPAEYYGDDVAGHIVADYTWNFFAVVTLKQAERFVIGDKLQILFPDVNEEMMPVKVVSVEADELAGIAKVQLECEYINDAVLGLRAEKAQIVFSVQKGLRISKDAIRMIEGESKVYVKFGNVVNLKKVKILLEDDFYVLIPSVKIEGENEVGMYDAVVVDPGGKELEDGKIV